MESGIRYEVVPLKVFRPTGKNEVRLVYQVVSTETPGLSTKHQKSFSICKLSEKGAWKAALDAFEICERTGDLPEGFVLPAAALQRTPTQERRIKTVSQDYSEAIASYKRAHRGTKPTKELQHLNYFTNFSVGPTTSTEPILTHNHVNPVGAPIPGVHILVNPETFAKTRADEYTPPVCSLLLNHNNESTNPCCKVLRFMDTGIDTDMENMVRNHVIADCSKTPETSLPAQHAHLSEFLPPPELSFARESSVWATVPPYTHNLLNWIGSAQNFHRNDTSPLIGNAEAHNQMLSLEALHKGISIPIKSDAVGRTPTHKMDEFSTPSTVGSTPIGPSSFHIEEELSEGHLDKKPHTLPGLPGSYKPAVLGGLAGSRNSDVASTGPGAGNDVRANSTVVWASVPLPQLHLL